MSTASTVTFTTKENVTASLNTTTGETKIAKWNNESYLKITPSLTLVDSTKDATDKYKLTYGEYAIIVYEVPEGLEYEIQIGKLPNSNVFNLPMATDNLTFYYQPPLTQELNPADYDSITETQAIKDGKVYINRPENIVGSYAAYHSTKKNGNYKTGKAFHIYRPKAIAADGKTIWGTLNIENNVLTITVDQAWLNKAKYPVIIDPTFGYSSIGGSNENNWNGTETRACKFTLSEAGTITNVKVYALYMVTGGYYYICGIYNDNSGTPNSKVEQSATEIDADGMTNPDWFSYDFNYAASAADYHLAYSPKTSGNSVYYYDSGATNQLSFQDGNLPASFGTPTSQAARIMSIYATYTASGGAGQQLFTLINEMGY